MLSLMLSLYQKEKRVARFEEYLELVQKLWTEMVPAHSSETCILNNIRMNVRPVQSLGRQFG